VATLRNRETVQKTIIN